MAFRYEKSKSGNQDLIIDGWENGIALSPYKGIGNIRNLNTSYYPGVAYVNYARQACTFNTNDNFFAGIHSTNVSNNSGWVFTAPGGFSFVMGDPIQKATSPQGLNYILDNNGNIWKQDAVNATSFTYLAGGTGRVGLGNAGLAYWNNYLWVFGDGLIEVCGDGSGDAGIVAANWNLNTGTGFSTNPTTFTVGSSPFLTIPARNNIPKFKNGDPVTLTTTGTLPAGLAINTTYYIVQFQNSTTSSDIALSTSYANTALTLTAAPNTGDTSATLTNTWGGTTGTYTVLFSTGEFKTTTLTNGSAGFSFSALGTTGFTTALAVVVTITSAGTGTHTILDTASPLPIGNCTAFQMSFNGSFPYASGTIISYVNPKGQTVYGIWQEPTGSFNIVMEGGQKVPAAFINGSSQVLFKSPLNHISSGNDWQVQLLDTTVTFYRPYVSKISGNLLFCNGQYIGALLQSPDPNMFSSFSPSLPITYSVNFGITSIPTEFTDVTTGMIDLQHNLIISGRRNIYTWDYTAGSAPFSVPIGEDIVDMTNLLNNIYILAGQKGNIYTSNGFSAQLLYKMPDFIAGTIDPIWLWGGLMTHRSKLYFQALAKKPQ